MTATTITAAGASDSLAITSGNDGTLVIQSGPTGAKVNALTLSSAGVPTFDQLAKTLGSSGTVTLPSGLIIKWGSATSGAGTNTVTYPTAFPTATVFATCIHTSAAVYVWPITAKAAASFNNVCYTTGGTPTASIAYDWLAIGY